MTFGDPSTSAGSPELRIDPNKNPAKDKESP
jgi:hypothetical protein